MSAIDVVARTVTVDGEGTVGYDSLVIATGWNYADPGVPGGDLDGLYYVKNIRKAMEWDKVIAETKAAVVVEPVHSGWRWSRRWRTAASRPTSSTPTRTHWR